MLKVRDAWGINVLSDIIIYIWVARRPPGYSFIDFDDRRDAEDAIREMDGLSAVFSSRKVRGCRFSNFWISLSTDFNSRELALDPSKKKRRLADSIQERRRPAMEGEIGCCYSIQENEGGRLTSCIQSRQERLDACVIQEEGVAGFGSRVTDPRTKKKKAQAMACVDLSCLVLSARLPLCHLLVEWIARILPKQPLFTY
ncbi:hypothetical protein IEQ34_013173 [Dendrobium chrysotoxum]|uniref:RRM domain-containing protein n=1 Tax=Dendrobium chrysotoxum TaxID=161865 RepID=A0AAV7GQA1_DENCH|nr:hypothetical protein IEQ34_013173 [Dendrobium chrysotoxum]